MDQDRVTIREAADRLGVTESAIRKRIQRGQIENQRDEDGRVYVFIDSVTEEDSVRDMSRDIVTERLRDEVDYLRGQLERRTTEAERYQQIIAGLTHANANLSERVRALEPPRAPESVEDVETKEDPPENTEGPETGARRPWWKFWS